MPTMTQLTSNQVTLTKIELGGDVDILARTALVLSERMEMRVDSEASTTVNSSQRNYSHTASEVSTSVATGLNLSAQTTYQYWLQFDDGHQELTSLPFAAREGQILATCMVRRHCVGTVRGLVETSAMNKTRPLFFRPDLDWENKKFTLVELHNLSTNERWSDFDAWIRIRMSTCAKLSLGIESDSKGANFFVHFIVALLMAGLVGRFLGTTFGIASGLISFVLLQLLIKFGTPDYAVHRPSLEAGIDQIRNEISKQMTQLQGARGLVKA